MDAIYRNFYSSKLEDICSICRDPIKSTFLCSWVVSWIRGMDPVAHIGGGTKHPLHYNCAKVAAGASKRCPNCRTSIDITYLSEAMFLVPWEGRYITELKTKGKEVLQGASHGVLLAASMEAVKLGAAKTLGLLGLKTGVAEMVEGLGCVLALRLRILKEGSLGEIAGMAGVLGLVGALEGRSANEMEGMIAVAAGLVKVSPNTKVKLISGIVALAVGRAFLTEKSVFK